MSHTPAPWTVDDTLVVNDQLNVEIANISFVDCVDDNHGAWDFGKQSQANALLIAAAPDLLAKCEKMVAWLDRLAAASAEQAKDTRFKSLSDACTADAKNYKKTADDIRAVIAKATGAA